jgi:hypothetical protein
MWWNPHIDMTAILPKPKTKYMQNKTTTVSSIQDTAIFQKFALFARISMNALEDQ